VLQVIVSTRKRAVEKSFVDLVILNNAESIQNSQKILVENLLNSIHVGMIKFLTPIMPHSFWAGEQTLISDLSSIKKLLLLM